MTTENESENEKLNMTDIYVVFDPSTQEKLVLKEYNAGEGSDIGTRSHQEDSTQIDGIKQPIIQVNNRVVNANDIDSFEISTFNILPTFSLILNDSNGYYAFSDTPTYDNHITVVLTQPGDLTYKKIKLDFYITKFEQVGGQLHYDGVYKNLDFTSKMICKQIKNEDGGQPSTYELCYQIAKECGLGFAASEKCASLNDNKNVIASGTTYDKLLEKYIDIGGNEDEDIFDCWVDLYGYLTLVNVGWIFGIELTPNDLSIQAYSGWHGERIIDQAEVEYNDSIRTITNIANTPAHNLKINSWNETSDTNIFSRGSSFHYNTLQLCGNSSSNYRTNISQHDIQLVDDVTSGVDNINRYTFERNKFCLNFDGDGLVERKTIHQQWMNKKRAKRLIVELCVPNFGLLRGTLVNVALIEYDAKKKAKIISSLEQFDGKYGDDDDSRMGYTEEEQQAQDEYIGDISSDGEKGLLNMFTSGIYYIDGVDFNYDTNGQEITQTLYLLKHSGIMSTMDNLSVPKFRMDSLETKLDNTISLAKNIVHNNG